MRAPIRQEDLDGLDHLVEGVPVSSGVHPNRAAHGRRDRDAELEARQAVGERHSGQSRKRHRGARGQAIAVSSGPAEGLAEPNHDAREAQVPHQEVGSLTDHEQREVRLRHSAAHGREVL
jgi:hypothetical protein